MDTINTAVQIEELVARSQEADQYKADYTGTAKMFSFDDQARVIGNPGIELFQQAGMNFAPLSLTDWASRQLYERLGKTVFGRGTTKRLPYDFMQAETPRVRAFILNDAMQRHNGRGWMFRAFNDACRAVLSDQYKDIPNTELLQIVERIVKEANTPSYIVGYSDVNPDTVNLRTIWQEVETPRDHGGNNHWGIGVHISNNEIGGGFTWVKPLIKRTSCNNSISVDLDKWTLRLAHRGGSSLAKMVQIKTAMQEALPFAAQLLERMIEADSVNVPEFGDVLRGLALEYRWSDRIYTEVVRGTENVETLAGIVNGVTFAGHSIPNPDDRADMEALGGRILLEEHPESLFARAIKLARREEAVV